MSDTERPPDETATESEIDRLLAELERLEATVDDPEEREQVRRTMTTARRITPAERARRHIRKYTTRDVAETFVGGVLFSLPFLVEDGIFEIAEWFLATTVSGLPVFLVTNVLFTVLMVYGLVYWSDIRSVDDPTPLLGFAPRRLIGVLVISFATATFLLVLWGRHAAGDPASALEVVGRIVVVWTAAAFGGALGDILPGESRGHDIRIENLDEIVGPD